MWCVFSISISLRMGSLTSCTPSGVQSLRRSLRSFRKPQLVSFSLRFLFKTMPCHASQKLILCVSVLHKLPSRASSLSSPPLLLSFHHIAVGFKLYYPRTHFWCCFWEDWLLTLSSSNWACKLSQILFICSLYTIISSLEGFLEKRLHFRSLWWFFKLRRSQWESSA